MSFSSGFLNALSYTMFFQSAVGKLHGSLNCFSQM